MRIRTIVTINAFTQNNDTPSAGFQKTLLKDPAGNQSKQGYTYRSSFL